MKQELYFSLQINSHPTYGKDFEKIKAVLKRYNVKYGFIEGTKDIWARDYMPVQDGKNNLVQFVYEPSYLEDDLHLQSNPADFLINGQRPSNTNITIKLDGGNFIKRGDKAIITERIFSENNIAPTVYSGTQREQNLQKIFETPFNSAQQKLIHDLERFLALEVIIIPAYDADTDLTGHSDGYIRFVHDSVVLISQLDHEEKCFADKMLAALQRHNLEYLEMPSFEYQQAHYPDSAIGCYLNYLELDDLIIFPIFDIYPKIDNQAIAVMKKHFPKKRIEPIVINDIARQGGLMNCISWTFQEKY